MAIDLNDEIMQDFLLEAGEILELLSEQLVELESRPDDNDLLNAVFRSFHTIKGGAGFLSIEPLVDVCHTAENVFDLLRQGQRSVNAELMDVMLAVLDVVNTMFQEINEAQDPTPAENELIERLKLFSVPESEDVPAPVEEVSVPEIEIPEETTPDPVETAVNNTDEKEATGSAIDEITDDEFEDLLDQLHGKGSHGGVPDTNIVANTEDDSVSKQEANAPAASNSDEITDDEFESLLDDLQANKQGAFIEAPVAAEKKEEVKAETKPKPVAEVPVDKPTVVATKAAPKAETTVRVETSTLDKIMNMVGELVLVRNRLVTLEAEIGNDDMSKTVSNLDVVTADLQSSVMKTRMQPIKKVFGRFPRVVRDLARSLKKDVVLKMIGEDTDLDKNLVEALADPLIHLVRNSVDHGIEMPDVREAAGKPRQGTVTLSAKQEGEHILLTISDDGAGIDAKGLSKNVIEKGLMDEDSISRLNDKEIYNLIFLPGFSIKKEISDISGRGVGMDVVKTRINQLNGMIEIDSIPGKGTTMLIKVPLTLAIMPTLMVKLGEKEQTFALPLVNVSEILELDMNNVNEVNGNKVIIVRGKPVPLVYLSNCLTGNAGNYEGTSAHVVIVTIGTNHVGLLVDKLVGREEVVIKPLGAMLQGTTGLAGATITGNGKIALIIDLPDLIQSGVSGF
ncbi:MAG: chemotaxis protein CheA [Proteobacteria bacterium]|nr:chemotaxis protein CheA [Pseudomonadota bacterium]NOG58957.1 chemotaxis protein CheA [Pseudomonadota bacterium]